MSPFTIRLTFHGDLTFFLKRNAATVIERHLSEKTSVKDVIESCGVPHPEVDLILARDQPVDFACVLEQDAELNIFPVLWQRLTFLPKNRLQLHHVEQFVADGHLGKLVRNLRLLGIDVDYDRVVEDRQLLDAAKSDNRALLTRDRQLLMHAVVGQGYYLRSQDPLQQTVEVLHRFDLLSSLAPFSRCLRCNASLQPVEKAEIIRDLEPLTKIYYDQFRRCAGCSQIYWPGSHFKKLQARIAKLRQYL